MIIGIGIDLVKISRIDKAGKHNAAFLERVFTEKEREYCSRQKFSAQHYAGRFAAKEAVLKAIGTGLSAGMKWTDIEVLHGEGGGPIVNISGRVKDLLDLKGVKQVMLTYSHDEGYAVAQVVLVGDGQRADERHE
ncbi:MAG TPA: holo-ACP synthase [Nitrospirota bacterium]|nr:holo-ACP synthase [Nitrospirota bacterium]